jgi:hypothetical protein
MGGTKEGAKPLKTLGRGTQGNSASRAAESGDHFFCPKINRV